MLSTASPPPTEILLGTVQLGMRYGINPALLDHAASERILDAAWDAGLRSIDTARAYGEAEARIGDWMRSRKRQWRIVTKVSKHTGDAVERPRWIADQFSASRAALGVDRVEGLLAHNAQDFLDPAGQCAFQEAIERGEAAVIGASTYEPADTRAVLAAGAGAVQVPASIADWRHETFLRNDGVGALMVRSLFLQSALLMSPTRLPSWLAPLRTFVTEIASLAASHNRSATALVLQAARDGLGVRRFVLGFDAPEQIAMAVEALRGPVLPAEAIARLRELAILLPVEAIDPRRWPKESKKEK